MPPGRRLVPGIPADCPTPQGDSHPGPVHGESPGKSQFLADSSRSFGKPASTPLPGHGFRGGYHHDCPRPREGAGWGLPERNCWVTFCPGRGNPPSPVPAPRGRYSHGPLRGEIPEKNRIRLIPGYLPGHCPRPYQSRGTEGSAPWGRGRRPDMVCYFGIDVLDTITIFL